MKPAEIYRHDEFYRDNTTRAWQRKYFVVLAPLPGGDLVARLLTSRAHGRPENPRCYHAYPYSGFYVGVLGAPLEAKTWVDLRYLDDIDPVRTKTLLVRGIVAPVTVLTMPTFVELLDCAARADDTSMLQERAILDQMSLLNRH